MGSPFSFDQQRTRSAWLAFIFAFSAPLAVMWPSLRFGFHAVDDPGYVTANPIVQQGLTWWGAWWALTTFEKSNWHPLTWLSYMLDIHLFGVNAGALRLVSLLLHGLAAATLLAALWQMTEKLWLSTLAAALFAIHPARLESVVWISERKDVLAGFFFALTLLLYSRKPRPNVVAVAAAMALGIAAKPSAVVLPVVLILLDFWPLRRGRADGEEAWWRWLWKRAWEKAPLFALSLVGGTLTVLAQGRGDSIASLRSHPISHRLLVALNSTRDYVTSTFWPVDLRFFYSFPEYTVGGTSVAVLLVAGISLASIKFARRWPHLSLGWWWFVVSILPTIGLIQVGAQARADRYTYLPSIGVFIAVTWSLGHFATTMRRRVIAVGLAVVALIALAATTRRQLDSWRSDKELWGRVVSLEPDRYWGWLHLGLDAIARGAYLEAIPSLQRATDLKVEAGYPPAMLAVAWSRLGDHPKALHFARIAIDRDPDTAPMRRAASEVLRNAGRLEAAASQTLIGIAVDPKDPQLYSQLAGLVAAGLEQSRLQELLAGIPPDAYSAELRAVAQLLGSDTVPVQTDFSSEMTQAGVMVVADALRQARSSGEDSSEPPPP